MMFDFLTTCYGNYITISRPQTLTSSLNNSYEEEQEREPSPVHLSSAMSTSSRVSCFSQRLYQSNNNENNIKLAKGRGKGIETNLSPKNTLITKQINNDQEDSIANSNRTSPVPSIADSSKSDLDNNKKSIQFIFLAVSSVFGRGRGAIFK